MDVIGNRLSDRFDSTLKLLAASQIVAEICHDSVKDRIQRLLARAAAAQADDAEDRVARLPGPLHIALVILRLHIDGGLDECLPEIPQRAASVVRRSS